MKRKAFGGEGEEVGGGPSGAERVAREARVM